MRFAQRAFGPAPVLDATLAWLYQAQGDYRAGINAMKRAYPQYLSEDGSLMPVEALRVIFPLDYWELIRKHATARGLDPFLVAALVAQESSFDADVRSGANAYGLMQIVPATGKRLARSLGIRRFSTSTLTNPETNVRLGTLYFKNLVAQFGGTHYALASYNAGESRVVRWINERGELPRDEFIDDIPFPETQNYVKKILGTAEDYRRLYGERASHAPRAAPGNSPPQATAARLSPGAGSLRARRLPWRRPLCERSARRGVSSSGERRRQAFTMPRLRARFRADDLARRLPATLLTRAGLADERARRVADVLLEGDLLGHSTHGLDLLAAYLREIDAGRMTREGEPETLSDLGAVMTWDGRYLPGPWLVTEAIARAQQPPLDPSPRHRRHSAQPSHRVSPGLPEAGDRRGPGDAADVVGSRGGRRDAAWRRVARASRRIPMAAGIPTDGDPDARSTSACRRPPTR